jgi:hypothetical protein
VLARAVALASVVRSEQATSAARPDGAGAADAANSPNGAVALDRIAAVTDDLFPPKPTSR